MPGIISKTKRTLFQRPSTVFRKHRILCHVVVSCIATAIVIGASFGIAEILLLREGDYPISLADGSAAVVRYYLSLCYPY
jgi:hypothetical protein